MSLCYFFFQLSVTSFLAQLELTADDFFLNLHFQLPTVPSEYNFYHLRSHKASQIQLDSFKIPPLSQRGSLVKSLVCPVVYYGTTATLCFWSVTWGSYRSDNPCGPATSSLPPSHCFCSRATRGASPRPLPRRCWGPRCIFLGDWIFFFLIFNFFV